MRQSHDIDRVDRLPTVVEFFGLPGAGKTTIADEFARVLRAHGYDVRTTADFVRWLSKLPRMNKLCFVLSALRKVTGQLFWCALFGLRLRPVSAISLSKIARVPYVNISFERYLETLDKTIVVMDQANLQLLWSAGAFATKYHKSLLHRAYKATRGVHPRQFVCLTPNVANTAVRLCERASNHSRFNLLSGVDLDRTLRSASSLITDLREFIYQDDLHVTDVDASLPPEENAHRLASRALNTFQGTNNGTTSF